MIINDRIVRRKLLDIAWSVLDATQARPTWPPEVQPISQVFSRSYFVGRVFEDLDVCHACQVARSTPCWLDQRDQKCTGSVCCGLCLSASYLVQVNTELAAVPAGALPAERSDGVGYHLGQWWWLTRRTQNQYVWAVEPADGTTLRVPKIKRTLTVIEQLRGPGGGGALTWKLCDAQHARLANDSDLFCGAQHYAKGGCPISMVTPDLKNVETVLAAQAESIVTRCTDFVRQVSIANFSRLKYQANLFVTPQV